MRATATSLMVLMPMLFASVSACHPASKTGGEDAAVVDAGGPPVTFMGRCVNETAGTPYQSFFFFPKHNEMFIYTSAAAFRVPLTVVKEAPQRLDFTFRWSEEKEPPSTQAGSVSAIGDKWQFDFDVLKDSICKPGAADDFYRILPDLGVQAGKWADPVDHFGIVIAADSQTWVLKQRNETTFIHYRILEHAEKSFVVASYGKTSSDTDDETWPVTRLTLEGDTLTHEIGDLTNHYKLTAAAPSIKPTP